MKKVYTWAALVAFALLGLAQPLGTARAAVPYLTNPELKLWRDMEDMEQAMDRDMAAQRRFFSDWMDSSLTTPDPFADIWKSHAKDLENIQTRLAADRAGATAGDSNLRLTGSNGSLLQLSSWSSNGPAQTDISYAVSNQTLDGDVSANGDSSLKLTLQHKTFFKGALNKDKKAQAVSLSLDADSVWDVTDTSYVTVFTDEDQTLANVHSNGHTIYYDATKAENDWLKGETKTLPGGGQLTPEKVVETEKGAAK